MKCFICNKPRKEPIRTNYCTPRCSKLAQYLVFEGKKGNWSISEAGQKWIAANPEK